MNEKHTPGPWAVSGTGGEILAQDGEWLAQLWDKLEEDFKNFEANANLISAAPELLEACEAEEYSIAVNGEYYRQCDLSEAPSEGWARLTFDIVVGARTGARDLRRAAIAKACGEVT